MSYFATNTNLGQLTNKVKKNTYTSAVTGWDSNFEVPGGWKFNLPDVMVSLNS